LSPCTPYGGVEKISVFNLNIIITRNTAVVFMNWPLYPHGNGPRYLPDRLKLGPPATGWTIFRWKVPYPCRQSNHGFSIIPPAAWTLQQPHNSASLTLRIPATIYGSRTAMRRNDLK
jgi:hypothetical protein